MVGPAMVMLLTLSCGSSSSNNNGGTPCQMVGGAICTKACACTDGPGCNLVQDGLTVTFDTEADCRGFMVTLACSDSTMPGYNDAAACLPLVNAAMCTGTGTDGALMFPADAACQSP